MTNRLPPIILIVITSVMIGLFATRCMTCKPITTHPAEVMPTTRPTVIDLDETNRQVDHCIELATRIETKIDNRGQR